MTDKLSSSRKSSKRPAHADIVKAAKILGCSTAELADVIDRSLAASSERAAIIEECARRCDSYAKTGMEMSAATDDPARSSSYYAQVLAAESCAENIRALNNHRQGKADAD